MPGPRKTRTYDKSSYGISVNADHAIVAVAEFFAEFKSRGYPTYMLLTYDTTADYDLNTHRSSFGDPSTQILFSTEPCQSKDILDMFFKHYQEAHGVPPSAYINLAVRKIYR